MTVQEALQALATPEPEPFHQVDRTAADWAAWDAWNTRRIEALRLAKAL